MDNNICEQESGVILWFTGLSGSGKTTIAERISVCLQESNISVQIIDGDQVRTTRHRHLGFSERDIKTNNELAISSDPEENRLPKAIPSKS